MRQVFAVISSIRKEARVTTWEGVVELGVRWALGLGANGKHISRQSRPVTLTV